MAALELWYTDPHNQFLLGAALGLACYGAVIGLVCSMANLIRGGRR